MQHITGHHLTSVDGEDIGEIIDVLGSDLRAEPRWLAVKTGWFSQRLVPYAIVVEHDEEYVTACTATDVKDSPKVSVHIEPAGEDLDALSDYYALRPAADA